MNKQPSLWNRPSPRHGQGLDLDRDLGALRGGEAFPPGFDPRAIAARARRRRRSIKGAAAVCLAAFLVLVGAGVHNPADYSAPVGAVALFELPDGTQVALDSGASLSWSETATERRVVLHEGGAVFETAPGDSRPFLVETEKITAQPIGTIFGVSAVEGPWLSIVEQGRVIVSDKDGADAVTLGPGKAAVIAPDSTGLRAVDADPARVLAWRDGYIDFENANLTEVVETLDRYYPGQLILLDMDRSHRTFDGAVAIDDFDAALATVALATGMEIILEMPFFVILR